MAITPAEIITTTALPEQTYASSGDNAITFMSLCNHGLDLITCDVHLVPSGDSPDSGNIMIQALEIQPSDTYIVYHGGEKIILSDGDAIMMKVVKPIPSGDPIGVTVITSHLEIS